MTKIKTTVIGSYPIPDYYKMPNWFTDGTTTNGTTKYDEYFQDLPNQHEYNMIKALKEVVETQDKLGIDIITDGEIKRENYIHYHLRFLDGVDFNNFTEKVVRNGAYSTYLPTVVKRIRPIKHYAVNDWKIAKLFTEKDIKVTLPGPMTILDTIANKYYDDEMDLLADLALTINHEIMHLVVNGCKYIQVDEPLFARKPKDALDFGIKFISKCFEGVPDHVEKTVHMCCGYPDRLDDKDYLKADRDAYAQIAKAIDNSCIDTVSLEDAHRHNDCELFKMFKKTKIILGVVEIASSKIESVEEIKSRIEKVLEHVPRERLLVAPDCGLAMLTKDICEQKLSNLVKAVNLINQSSS